MLMNSFIKVNDRQKRNSFFLQSFLSAEQSSLLRIFGYPSLYNLQNNILLYGKRVMENNYFAARCVFPFSIATSTFSIIRKVYNIE